MKKLLLIGLTIMLSAIKPVIIQAEETNEITVVTTAQFEEALENITDSTYKYANTANVNIRKEPNTESEILDQTLVNTEFQVILEIAGWSMITTDGGYAYIKTEYLSDDPVEASGYTQEDLYILAHVICGEAQPYSNKEQLYVGSVVLNRVNHSEFPDTIKGVVFQKGQYACTWDGNYYREPTPRNWSNARYLLEYGSILPDKVIWQSGAKQGKGIYIKTKYHYYCY